MHGASADEADDLAQECFVLAAQKGAIELAPAYCDVIVKRWESLNPDNQANLME